MLQRKVVTVLFCDVVGSTALGETTDPEALRALLARYFDRMKEIVERHGGTVEKFIGDAVMAVFGIPVAHEDDALRACRAAVEMRESFSELGVNGRIGVTTGEVVTGTEERLATGDAVNVAARLQQAAQPGEALFGGSTLELVREAVEVEPLEPLELKGKAEPVEAYRLIAVHEAPERLHASRFVGRSQEAAAIRQAWRRATDEERCELLTVVGEAGVGKSRLVAETLASFEARVVEGRCLPYGEGITYWPVVEVLKQLNALPSDAAAAASVRSLLGETGSGTSAEEIAWAFRKLLEEQAPLICVFDDIQWGEETFLDLIEHVALLSSGASVLILCMARSELLERRPTWPTPLRLEPLAREEIDELIGTELPAEIRERVAKAAGGNPLFVREMMAMAGGANGEVTVPPTLRAVVAARLDQLGQDERRVLERAAVEGESFHRGAVQALVPEEPQVTPRLAALVRKELIRPDRAHVSGEDGFRFRHLLIRDAAYDGLAKALRAELHERFADWLEGRGADLVELDELVGYHLELAWHYRRELALALEPGLAERARRHLGAAGRRARLRGDESAAVSLLERATAIAPEADLDVALEAELASALFWAGRGEEALQRARSTAARAAAAGNRVGELVAQLTEGIVRINLEPEGAVDHLAALVDEALPVFEAAGDDVALAVAYFALGWVRDTRAQMGAAGEALERAAAHNRKAGLPNEFFAWRSVSHLWGPTPIPELLAWLDEQEERAGASHAFRTTRAHALAMLGHVDEARGMLAEVYAELAARGGGIQLGGIEGQTFVDVELLAGDPAAAAEHGERGCAILEELGERGLLSTAVAKLAQAYYALGRLDDAEAAAARAAELGGTDDAITQMLSRQVRAKVLANRGEHAEAERLAREAVSTGEQTDLLNSQAEAHADLGEALSLAGRREAATQALEQALRRYERKGNLVLAERIRERLATTAARR